MSEQFFEVCHFQKMSRYSDDSDSDSSQRRSKKKKHKRSRSRSREKKSRHRSRTRSRDRRRRSRSRSKERRHRNRDRNRRRSRSRDRRSRSLSSSRSREDVSSSRVSSRDTSEVAVVEERQPVPSSTITNIADQLKRARAIAEIDSESFSQKVRYFTMKTDYFDNKSLFQGFRSSGIRSVKMDAGVEEVG